MSVKRRIADLIEKFSGNLVIPVSDVHGLSERLHLVRFFERFQVDCVFDVGANDGQYAKMLREAVGFRGHIVSYEPIPELAERMLQRQRATQDQKWHIEPLALDSEAGPAIFHVAEADQFSSLRTPDATQPARFSDQTRLSREVMVERSTIATELPKWQARLGSLRPFLKMDTQGNDLAVVEGAGPSLASFVGLQTELAIQRLYEGTPTYSETLSALKAKGFEPSAFVPNNDGHFPEMFEVDCILYNVAFNQPQKA